MNTTIPTLDQFSDSAVRDGLDAMTSAIGKAFLVEHNPNDSHSTIHATGPISERGRTTPMGEWVNVPYASVVLGIPGAGNSWVNAVPVPGTTFYQVSFVLIGKTMWLNISIPITTLTVAAATGIVTVNLPPGFRVAGVSAGGTFVGRSHFGHCVILNSGTQVPGVMYASAGATAVTVQQVSGANFVTDANFTVEGQLMLEVEAT